MSRKPYQKAQASNWYLQTPFFRRYMLRELTSVPVALVSINLCWGLISLADSYSTWSNWLSIQRHPLMLLLTIVGIIAALYNSKTWFEAMPKAVRIPVGDKFVGDKTLIVGSWLALLMIAVLLGTVVSYFAS